MSSSHTEACHSLPLPLGAVFQVAIPKPPDCHWRLKTCLSSGISACAVSMICPRLGNPFYGPIALGVGLVVAMMEDLHTKGLAVEGSLPLLTMQIFNRFNVFVLGLFLCLSYVDSV